MKHYLKIMLLLLSVSFCVVLTGCGPKGLPSGSLEGTVTFKGKPLTCGVVCFSSTELGRGGGGKIDANGKYKANDIVLGQYQIMIIPPELDSTDAPITDEIKNFPVPNKYRDFETSGLTITVEKGTKTFNIDL